MARVAYVNEEAADDVVGAAFERMRAKRGAVTNIYRALAHKPAIIATIGPFVAAVQAPDEIDAALKERIILRVSALNRSGYCVHAHRQISAKMGFTPQEVDAALGDPSAAGVDDAGMAALRYAEEMTLRPGAVGDDTFAALREHFSDSQIVEITMLAALYNMVNRFNEALRLDQEAY
jgi:uncharacterized peroxidase-related enzyme